MALLWAPADHQLNRIANCMFRIGNAMLVISPAVAGVLVCRPELDLVVAGDPRPVGDEVMDELPLVERAADFTDFSVCAKFAVLLILPCPA